MQPPLTTVSARLLCHTNAYPAAARFVSWLAAGGLRHITEQLVNIAPYATTQPHTVLCCAVPRAPRSDCAIGLRKFDRLSKKCTKKPRGPLGKAHPSPCGLGPALESSAVLRTYRRSEACTTSAHLRAPIWCRYAPGENREITAQIFCNSDKVKTRYKYLAKMLLGNIKEESSGFIRF